MKYYTIQPHTTLSPYVRFFWVLEGNVNGSQPYVHRTMADGCCELIFHYRGTFNELLANGGVTPSVISGLGGPSQKFNRYSIQHNFGIFGAYLYPFAIPSLFNIPASAIANEQPDLVTLLGQPGRNLEEQMMLAPDNHTRATLLNLFLTARLPKIKQQQPAVFSAIGHIIKTQGTVNIATLAGQYCLSTRQFERNFKAFAGFSPKLYSRITRFQAAMSQYPQQQKTLTAVAHQCGYYDQSHFIHDFKEFSGYHPKRYFLGDNEATAWRQA